jgi:hypothetical protein
MVTEPMTVDPTRPGLWPVMTEKQARQVLTGDMRVAAGVPASWWGETREIVVATHDRSKAAQAADELARQEFGVGYLTVAESGATVDGPIEAVLVGWVGSEHIEWRLAEPSHEYALYLCVVRPARPADSAESAVDCDLATSDPADAELLKVAAAVLSTAPGPTLGACSLSSVLRLACSMSDAGRECQARAERLSQELAAYLQSRHVLRFGQATPAGLDAWAERAPVVFLHAAVGACARTRAASVTGGTP